MLKDWTSQLNPTSNHSNFLGRKRKKQIHLHLELRRKTYSRRTQDIGNVWSSLLLTEWFCPPPKTLPKTNIAIKHRQCEKESCIPAYSKHSFQVLCSLQGGYISFLGDLDVVFPILHAKKTMYKCLGPNWPLFLKVNPPKQGLFQSKQG